MSFAAFLRRITGTSGIEWLYRSYIHTPGRWIYHPENLQWLCNKALVSQLPPIFRLFAGYCRVQLRTLGRTVGAEALLHTVFFLSNRFGLPRQVCLRVSGTESIFLNLRDPRFLVIPQELSDDRAGPGILKKFLKAGDTFIDVGANHGAFSVKASRLVGPAGLVVAVEPQPLMSALVQRSLETNAASLFTVLPIACGNRNGTIELFIPRASSGVAGVHPRFSAISSCVTIDVTVKRFDEAIDWRKLRGSTFVKLDIEGSELAFLEGADAMLRRLMPVILMEINPAAIQAAGASIGDLVQRLTTIGYREYCAPEDPKATFSLQELKAGLNRNIIVGNDIGAKLVVDATTGDGPA